MKLIIAEKPQLGQAIADALPGLSETKDGVIRKGDYTIVWAYGHLLTLKDPEDYDAKFEQWNLEDLPFYFENWGMKIGKDSDKKPGQQSKAARVKQIGDLLKQADCVIHAGDVDEEGQLLIDELLRWFSYKGPVWRLDTNNTAEAALKKALTKMKPNSACEADGWSAFGRELADKVFGFNLSRYFTIKNGTLLPVGRVQTPSLGLVVQRDAQIESHHKVLYYELFTKLSVINHIVDAKFYPDSENPDLTDGKFLDSRCLDQKARYLNNQSLSNIKVEKETFDQQPPLPFNLTKLTSYCSKRWGYNPDEVMKITQSLRENHKAITYNRSDCQYLSEEHFKEAPETVAAVAFNLGIQTSDFDTSIKSRCFNDANITAHFAIIPQAVHVDVSKMTLREKNIYQAICNYYLIQFMPPALKERTRLTVDLGAGEALKAVSTVILNPGYLAFLSGESPEEEDSDAEEGSSDLSRIPAGTYRGTVKSTEVVEKETRPPSRYTQASLAEDMTRVAKYINDPYIKKLLLEKDKDKKGENGSIGTTATRPFIIKQLIARGYLAERKEGKRTVLISTPKGRDFYRMLPDEIKTADLTAKWWSIQEDIKLGVATPDQMARDVLATVRSIIASGIGTMSNAEAYANGGTGVILGQCPLCGGNIIEKDRSYSCSNKDCNCVYFKDHALLKSVGKKMTATIVKGLISKGEVLLKDCKSRSGNIFDCILRVSYGDKNPTFTLDFDSVPELGHCPLCGGLVSKNKFGNYSCDSWKDGCRFTIFGTIAGKKLSDKNIKDLLSKGCTAELHGFTGKSGKKFDASLVLESDGKISFKFIDHSKKW